MNPYKVVEQFERQLCDYTNAPYAVTTTSCTSAILLALMWAKQKYRFNLVIIPKHTYVGVAQSVLTAGFKLAFDVLSWEGHYDIYPTQVYDYARHFTKDMFSNHKMVASGHKYQCVSFHWSKTLGIGQGGAILHDDAEADEFFRKARFDGRTPGVAPKEDTFIRGHHCYMSPRDAADGISRLAVLPKHNDPIPNDDYPDLSLQEVFK